jgi:hypothetical protein
VPNSLGRTFTTFLLVRVEEHFYWLHVTLAERPYVNSRPLLRRAENQCLAPISGATMKENKHSLGREGALHVLL